MKYIQYKWKCISGLFIGMHGTLMISLVTYGMISTVWNFYSSSMETHD